MKKLTEKTGLIILSVFLAVVFLSLMTTGQTVKKQLPGIPDDVKSVFMNSCMPCHGEKGGRLSRLKLDFSKWHKYSDGKRTKKASRICSILRKGAMPPRVRREAEPELTPTPEQINLICSWSESLKGKGKM